MAPEELDSMAPRELLWLRHFAGVFWRVLGFRGSWKGYFVKDYIGYYKGVPFIGFRALGLGVLRFRVVYKGSLRCIGLPKGWISGSAMTLVAEWIHFTLFGAIVPTIKLKV